MTPNRHHSAPRVGTAIDSDLFASAIVRATVDMLPVLRQRPGPGIGEALPATVLRHADEQTLTALAAVLHAIHHSRMSVPDFRDWGIVAAPCFLGRATMAVTLQRLAAEGAWGISPHVIPHRSQHAVSGTISQVLRIYGPNFGAGGGPGGVVEGLLAGSVLLEGSRLPGVWIVLTQWEPEAIPDQNGRINPEAACHAVALALVGARPGWQGLRLRVVPSAQGTRGMPTSPSGPMPSQLGPLLTALVREEGQADKVVWPLQGGGWVELGRSRADAGVPWPEKVQRLGRGRVEVQQSGAGTENKR